MSLDFFETFLSLFLAASISLFVYIFLAEFGERADELKAEQIEGGDQSLAELYIKMSPSLFFFFRMSLTALCAFFGFLVGGVAAAVIAGGIMFMIPKAILANLKEKRVKKIEQQLVEALELMGNSLKSGLTMPQAVELVVKEFPVPIKQEFALVLAESRLGVEFGDALKNMANRLQSNIVGILAAGVGITKRVGGDMTVIFGNIAQTIRDQANIEGKLDAVTAQGRFQGLVLGFMPFALIGVLYFLDRNHVETLFKYQLGIWAFGGVVAMVIIAQVWIRRLLRIDV